MRLVGCECILFPCAVVLSLYGWLGSNVMAADLSRQLLPLYSSPSGKVGDTERPSCTEEKKYECLRKNAVCKEPEGKCFCEGGKEITLGKCRACTEERIARCTKIGTACYEPKGECRCRPGLQVISDTCREPTCTKLRQEECSKKRASCSEPLGDCVCEPGMQMIGNTCKACTEERNQTCTEKGAICQEPEGKCVCRPGQQMIYGTCRACTAEKNESCSEKGATCQEPDGRCVCKPGKQMIYDTCRACTAVKNETCSEKGATCQEPDGSCVCQPGQQMIYDTCRACTAEKNETCSVKGATCQEPDGRCVCQPGQQIVYDTCRACTAEKNETCSVKLATCQEPDGRCICQPGKLMIYDRCRACTAEKNETCSEKGATCQEPDGMCVCEPGQQMIYGTCRGCTEEKNRTCAEKGATCQEPLGECVCEPGRQMIGAVCKETTSTGTEPSNWQSGHATEHTTVRSVTSGSGTGECDDQVCNRPGCACASDAPPAGLRVDEMPQFVMLTFDGAVNAGNMAFYRELLDTSRRKKKQNGCGIAATFFVSGEYLDYEAVNHLHSWGNEIALKSISNRVDSSYWQTINSTQWEREVLDQRAMLKAFANVPDSDVTGFRGPFLITGGDQGFSMLHKHFRYDSTLVHQRIRGGRPVYPYTMDFGFRRTCNVLPCPEATYPGLWVLPMNVLFAKQDGENVPCAMADACLPQPVTANDTFDYLKSNFDEFYTTNRAPFPIFLHEAYLHHPERKAGYLRFVDWLLEKDDVYLVTASEVLRFMEDPKPLSAYANRQCSGQIVHGASTCPRPTTCSYKNTPPGGERYMRTCSQCPRNYPWVNNPLGN